MRISDWSSDVCFSDLVEVDGDVSDALSFQLAGRYEHYSDFGHTLNGKVAARFEIVPGVALRGSASTGFRAPSLAQQFFATTSTNNVAGTLIEVGTFPVSNPVSVALGRAEEDTSEIQSPMRTAHAVFCLKKKKID